MTERRRSRWPRRFVVFLIVIVVLWCGLWFAASWAVQYGAGRVATSMAAQGRQLNCADSATGGFPFVLNVSCGRVTFADPKRGMSGSLAGVAVNAPLLPPGAVNATLQSPLLLAVGPSGPGVTATWAGASGNAVGGLGGLQSVSGGLDGFALAPSEGTTLPVSNVAASHADFALAPADAGNYRLVASAAGVAVTLANGPPVPKLAVDVDATAKNLGSSLGTDPKATLHNWIANGGNLAVDELTLSTDATSVNATGNLTLADTGLLSGSLILQMTGLDALPDLVEQFRPGSRDKVQSSLSMMTAVARRIQVGDKPGYQIALTVQAGRVAIGGFIPIGNIPPLKF